MKRLVAFALAALFATSATAEPPLKPGDFVNRSAIIAGGNGPFHQVVLPLAVYNGLTDPSLADLRVFNARGEAVPYAILRSDPRPLSRETETSAPMFPLFVPKSAPDGTDTMVTVRQLEDGKLISVRKSQAKPEPGEIVKGVIIDASGLKNVRSLRLVTSASSTPFHSYTIESSDDLQHWRLLKRAQIAHLDHAGHRIDSDGTEWDASAGRYLRVIWDAPEQAPAIEQVLFSTVETRAPERMWSEQLAPVGGKFAEGEYEYELVGQIPLDRVRINFAQVNTLAPLTLQYRVEQVQPQRRRFGLLHRRERQPQLYWTDIAHTVAYRLQTPQGEARSADVAVYGVAAKRLRLVADARSGSLGETPPTLQIGFVPHVLVFLARGEGPFTLAWGADGVDRADLPVATLIPGYDSAAPVNASPASLTMPPIVSAVPDEPPAEVAPEEPASSSKWVLWLVLGAGLLVLGGMARSLTRQLR